MHDCIDCEGSCDCDGEDHHSSTPDDCEGCGCADDDSDDDQWWEEDDDDEY